MDYYNMPMKSEILLLINKITRDNFEIYGNFLMNLLFGRPCNKLNFFSTNRYSFHYDIWIIKQIMIENGYTIISTGITGIKNNYETFVVKKDRMSNEIVITFCDNFDFSGNLLQSKNNHMYVSSKSYQVGSSTMVSVLYVN